MSKLWTNTIPKILALFILAVFVMAAWGMGDIEKQFAGNKKLIERVTK